MFVKQPICFETLSCHDLVFKLSKALYSLKQDPKALNERLSTSLIKYIFIGVKLDTNLFTQKFDASFFIVQICVDDIIFGSCNFANLMEGEFEMSLIGEISFLLGLQINQTDKRIFIS